MTTVDEFDLPRTEVPRDRFRRPLVVPPEGGKPVPYTRCTTYVDCLDDKYNLQMWQRRMVALGLADRPDLLLAVAAHRGDKKALNDITDRALEAAQAGAAATTGTAEHALAEQIDRGQPLGVIPAAYQADLEAYRQATACLRMVEIEQFTVLDSLKIGGTPDRVVKFNGLYYIADLKTGSIDWSGLKICMQLAVYARCTPYDPGSGQRAPRPYPVEQDVGIVIHLPAGEGRCDLHWANLRAGWDAVRVAGEVRAWRARKHWFSPFTPPTPPNLAAAIAAADTVGELRSLWSAAVVDGTWTDDHLIAALERKAVLEGQSTVEGHAA